MTELSNAVIDAIVCAETGFAPDEATQAMTHEELRRIVKACIVKRVRLLAGFDAGTEAERRLAAPEAAEPQTGSWIAAEDARRSARAIDVALNGEDGAAKAPALIDVEAQIVGLARSLGRPIVEAAGPVALWQYRWTNPGNLSHQSVEALAWRPVEPGTFQTVEDKCRELAAYEHNGKRCYEVRALYAGRAPADSQAGRDAMSRAAGQEPQS